MVMSYVYALITVNHHSLTYWEIILSMIIPIQITYSPTYTSVQSADIHRYSQWQWRYCWGKLLLCSSNCKQICGTPLDIVSWLYCKCQTWAGVSGDVNKPLECVTITDCKFSDRVLVRMTPKSTSINCVTISLVQFHFCPRRGKWELPDQHIASCRLPTELFLNIFIISTVCSHDMS